jgi:hypothetical protein
MSAARRQRQAPYGDASPSVLGRVKDYLSSWIGGGDSVGNNDEVVEHIERQQQRQQQSAHQQRSTPRNSRFDDTDEQFDASLHELDANALTTSDRQLRRNAVLDKAARARELAERSLARQLNDPSDTAFRDNQSNVNGGNNGSSSGGVVGDAAAAAASSAAENEARARRFGESLSARLSRLDRSVDADAAAGAVGASPFGNRQFDFSAAARSDSSTMADRPSYARYPMTPMTTSVPSRSLAARAAATPSVSFAVPLATEQRTATQRQQQQQQPLPPLPPPLSTTAGKRSYAAAIGSSTDADDDSELPDGKRRQLTPRHSISAARATPTTSSSVRSILSALGKLTSPLVDAAQASVALARASTVDRTSDEHSSAFDAVNGGGIPQSTRATRLSSTSTPSRVTPPPTPLSNGKQQRDSTFDGDETTAPTIGVRSSASTQRAPPTRTLDIALPTDSAAAARRDALIASDRFRSMQLHMFPTIADLLLRPPPPPPPSLFFFVSK